ncbi:hypothetical protein Lalb_Chr03g0030251 [Lupinus albus]|uniref:Uncharacterized protein n=1 Tax=Lupinus albus TaxID=3870 RepID=A0A6A4QTX5_LUPAL|nr:hypothetical protein Lalb_Chr03g0030251 [Lupinus albus]
MSVVRTNLICITFFRPYMPFIVLFVEMFGLFSYISDKKGPCSFFVSSSYPFIG